MSTVGLYKQMMMDIIVVVCTSTNQVMVGQDIYLLRVDILGKEIWQSHGVLGMYKRQRKDKR